MGIPNHLTCLLRNLYAGQEATVRTLHGTTDWFKIGKGVRQSCILSPFLFNLYAEASQVALVKNLPANAGRHKRHRFNSWVRKISCKGNGSPLQYSCLENPMDREAWQAIVHGVTKSQTQLKQLSTAASSLCY